MKQLILCLALLPACEAQFNDTDGAAYLAARPGAPIDPEIAEAARAQTRPALAFPARIGLVRIVYNRATLAPAAEAADWAGLITRAQGFGTFLPLVPGATELDYRPHQSASIAALRQSAAAQLMDYILVTTLDIANGTATAQFIDVRSGFVYATATTAVSGGGQNGFWGGQIRNPSRRSRAARALANALLPEVEDMLIGLAERT